MPEPDADAGMESALLVLVPEADPVVGEHRALLDLSARAGVPAHVTVLYPFLPPQRIGPEELTALTRLFAGFQAFDFTLDKVGWFGDAVTWLGPADDTPFRALTALACAAYPSCPPYGGAHDVVVPHLTIGHLGGMHALRAAADSVRPRLPHRGQGIGGHPDDRPGSGIARPGHPYPVDRPRRLLAGEY